MLTRGGGFCQNFADVICEKFAKINTENKSVTPNLHQGYAKNKLFCVELL